MAIGYLTTVLLAAAIAVFALQNSAHTSVRFLVWTFEGLPLAAVTLTAVATGIVVVGVPLWIRSWRWRSRARSAEARVATLEATLADRDAAQRQRPSVPPVPARPTP